MFTIHYGRTFEEGIAHFKGGYWAQVITAESVTPVRPDGSLLPPRPLTPIERNEFNAAMKETVS